MLVLKNMFHDKIKPTTEINDARLKRWVKAFPFTKDIIGYMERKPEWLQKHIFGNELIPYGQALFEELEPETQERVMQTISEDSNTNYDKIFLGYRLPEMGDQSPKAKRTWEIYNILGEHEAKMLQLEAEGKLPKATPKKKRRVEQSESSEEVTSSSESSGNEGKRRVKDSVKNSVRKKVKLGPSGFYYDI
ncbi:hypothetical protein TVAG_533250 [Trichomonas vaginalis G3]|uniref:Uncharacterized protein n=2 Tax=Trichomonas vaginalis (strain ATCC PRA-98 / G3) TaxID=412133 RepID=A2H1N1_TRIV3|nr:hypothetical protein TVAG_533250 [Trichomonas vaginalis G3]|eukprot:XP_001289615.1 hypothetical protein [Trichomonas vaginalis G3]